MSADLYFTSTSFFISSSFFVFCRLISEVAERNSTKIGHMVGSVIWKRMSEIWDTPSPYKSGAQKPPFWTTSQLNGNFNGLYLRNKTRYRQSVKCVDNYKGRVANPRPVSKIKTGLVSQPITDADDETGRDRSCIATRPRCLLHRAKMSWTLVHKQFQTRPAFLHILCKFRIPLHCQASQTEINKRNSTTLCQTVNSRPL